MLSPSKTIEWPRQVVHHVAIDVNDVLFVPYLTNHCAGRSVVKPMVALLPLIIIVGVFVI
jgi:hypothetical protein